MVREESGVPLKGPEGVGRPPRRFERGQKAHQEVRDWPVSGREAFPEVGRGWEAPRRSEMGMARLKSPPTAVWEGTGGPLGGPRWAREGSEGPPKGPGGAEMPPRGLGGVGSPPRCPRWSGSDREFHLEFWERSGGPSWKFGRVQQGPSEFREELGAPRRSGLVPGWVESPSWRSGRGQELPRGPRGVGRPLQRFGMGREAPRRSRMGREGSCCHPVVPEALPEGQKGSEVSPGGPGVVGCLPWKAGRGREASPKGRGQSGSPPEGSRGPPGWPGRVRRSS